MAQGVLFVTDTSFFAIPTRVSVAEKIVGAVPAILSFHQTINNEPSTIGEKTTSKHIRILHPYKRCQPGRDTSLE